MSKPSGATGERTLTPDDVGEVLDEIIEAQNQSYVIGLKLKLPEYKVESIHSRYTDPCKRLLQVLIEFTKQIEPKPTWRVIVDVLKSPSVNLTHLAREIERKHCPVSPPCVVPPETPVVELLPSEDRQPLSPLDLYVSYLKDQYKKDQLPSYNKWPHVKGKKFINLCLLSKYEVTPQQAHQYTKAMFHGEISSIDQNMSMEDIAKTDDGSILKGRQRCILIEGAPGVGKSTLAWKLCRKWGKGKILQQYQVVLLLRLQDKRVRQVNTEQGIFELCKPVAATKELCESRGEGVLLALDGWDELPVELREEDSIFLDLLQGQVLPDAAVLVTSRPHASEIIVTECRDCVFQHIQIAGFTDENIGAFVSSHFGEDPELLYDFGTYLDSYPHILSMMYNPLNAAIVVKVYKDCHNEKSFIPKTLTELYTSLILSLLLRYLRERGMKKRLCQFSDLPPDMHQQLCEVSKLAYEGITNQQQVIFDNLPDDFDSLGLMQCVPELYVDEGAVMSYNFLHLTIQEFFAAYHMSQQSTEEQVKMLELYQKDTSMKIVLKFFAGLTNFSDFSDDLVISLLTELRDLEKCIATLLVDGTHFLFEAKERIEILNTQSIVHYQLSQGSSPFDSYVLGYVMSHSLCMWAAELDPSYLMMFAKGASSDIPVSNGCPIQLQMSHPIQFQMSDCGFFPNLNALATASTHFLKRVKALSLQRMTLLYEDSYALFLSTHLQLHLMELIDIGLQIETQLKSNILPLHQLIGILHEQNTLIQLTISQNTGPSAHFFRKNVEWMQALGALYKWLSSSGCSLTTLTIYQLEPEAIEYIIDTLIDNCTLESLDLSFSSMSLEALSILLLLPLVTLNLIHCKFDSRKKELYSSSILEALDLCDEGVIALAKILKKNKTLKKLDLSYCSGLSQATLHILQDSIQHNDREIELILEHSNPHLELEYISLDLLLPHNMVLLLDKTPVTPYSRTINFRHFYGTPFSLKFHTDMSHDYLSQ